MSSTFDRIPLPQLDGAVTKPLNGESDDQVTRVAPPLREGDVLILRDARAKVVKLLSRSHQAYIALLRMENGAERILKCGFDKGDPSGDFFRREVESTVLASQRLPPQSVPLVYDSYAAGECKIQTTLAGNRRYALTEPTPLNQAMLLEYLNGCNLDMYTYQCGNPLNGLSVLTYEQTLPIALPLARIVEGVHKIGLVHRDLKSSNVMCVLKPEANHLDHIRLLDFGIATLKGRDEFFAPHGVTGTIGFIAPEVMTAQNQETAADPKVDLFGLGATLYDTHCVPSGVFAANFGRYIDFVRRLLSGEPLFVPPERENSPLVPIIRGLMAPYATRYNSAEEVVKALAPLVDRVASGS